MASSRSKEIRFWWPLPLATLIWLAVMWAFGFLLTDPKVEVETPPPIEASFVELPEDKPAPKLPPAPEPEKKPEIEPAPPPRSRPRLGVEKTEPAKPVTPKKGSLKEEKPSTTARVPQAEPEDLTAFMNKARERRRAGGIFEEDLEEPRNIEREPSEEEIRMANVKRNLREPGTSGIFQITRMGTRTAQFLFRAWRMDSSNPRREMINVTAGPDIDIQRAVARRMIELIREYHQEDFNWESYRLGRVVVLSARPEDSKGLEDFLIREFFYDPATAGHFPR